MKRLSIILSLFAAIVCSTGSVYGQASTEGKDFWVSSSLVCSPNSSTPVPYIAISAEKACVVTITDYRGNSVVTNHASGQVMNNIPLGAGTWTEFGNSNATVRLYDIDPSKWYPVSMNNADNVGSLADQKNMYGLHVTATENVSVYVILSSTNSMDASNILPMTALSSEYYTQDYWSKVKSGFNDAVGLTTILGTEDGTIVDITPHENTYNNVHPKGQTYQVTLNKGQTYYLVTRIAQRLSGTHICARNGKKIAVYCGVPITNIPTGIAARDCLFEQSMPIDYWGTKFIVTRSLQKNGNLVGITASKNDTEIMVDGYPIATIHAGDTYYIMMQNDGDPSTRDTCTSHRDYVVTADAIYIETSCPCAVYSYDTGNSFKGSTDEIVSSKGDPSSVWVSPVEQKIGKITFGTCYTDKTEDHFLNIVAETQYCQNTILNGISGTTKTDLTSLLQWIQVPGNPTYSYARAQIGNSSALHSVFGLENKKGFIAFIYGNGNDESYAYSAGSAAVKRGVRIDDRIFETSIIPDTIPFCMNKELAFNAKISGSEDIDGVDWDFGDGVTLSGGEEVVETNHTYTSPGWYDVSARLMGKPACSNIPSSELGTVSFSFYVNRPDTLEFTDCACESELPYDFYGQKFWRDTTNAVVADDNCGTVYKLNLTIAKEVTNDLTNQPLFGRDEYVFHGPNGDTTFTETCERYVVKYPSPVCSKCDSTVIYKIQIIHCLSIEIERYAQTECPGKTISIGYIKHKGNITGATLQIGGQEIALNYNNSIVGQTAYFTADLERITPGTYNNAKIVIVDESSECQQVVPLPPFTVEVSVLYPSNVFARKYYNVLAVLNSAYNGGYTFSGYQWYVRNTNDPTSVAHPIEGANEIIYHTDNLGMGYAYSVYLLNGGTWTMSCERVITDMCADSEPTPRAPEVRKMVKDQQLFIEVDGVMYDSMGNRVE